MKKTLRDFIKYSSIDAGLIRAAVRQSGGWESFQEIVPYIKDHGILGNFSGWIYYNETCQFYAKNQGIIVALIEEWANDSNLSSIDFVASFRCCSDKASAGRTLYGNKRQHDTQIADGLALFAVEDIVRSFVDWSESE